jgi:hypothetical protein
MRCREAKRRLTDSRRESKSLGEDKELLAHLAQCAHCAECARATGMLERVIEAAREGDSLAVTPLAEQRKLVEARLAAARRIQSNQTLPARLVTVLRSHRALSAAASVVVAALLVVTLVPFQYDHTIGYEVAVEGVHQNLVDDDNNTICNLLYGLGLIEADVDVLGCDSTCALTVYHLKSRSEAQLVIAALTRINPVSLTTDVKPVRATTSGSLLERANDKLLDETI